MVSRNNAFYNIRWPKPLPYYRKVLKIFNYQIDFIVLFPSVLFIVLFPSFLYHQLIIL